MKRKSTISPELRELAGRLQTLQKRARELGVFDNSRELLTCPKCGLSEDVTIEGLLLVSKPQYQWVDTGLRFKELRGGRFKCPVCRVAFTPSAENP